MAEHDEVSPPRVDESGAVSGPAEQPARTPVLPLATAAPSASPAQGSQTAEAPLAKTGAANEENQKQDAPQNPGSSAASLEPVIEIGVVAAGDTDIDSVSAAELREQQIALADAAVLADSRRHTRRSFAVAALGAAAAYGFYYWLPRSPQEGDQPRLLRRAFLANAAISRAVFDERALAPTYPLSKSETLRVNGVDGLKKSLILESWRLQLVGSQADSRHPRFASDVTEWEYRYTEADPHQDQGHDTKVAPSADTARKMTSTPLIGSTAQQRSAARLLRGVEEAGHSRSTLLPGTSGLLLTIDDMLQLPRHELVTQFKCIEGWSQIVHWAGVRMADFLEQYPPAPVRGREPGYVYMETPDGDYYTGYEMRAMRHPQTLLVTEMMGAPLTQVHGAPLRLHMPTRYGYKQIKRIGLISYNHTRPDDYWTKLGYDFYAGL